jgi:hypothetical protein
MRKSKKLGLAACIAAALVSGCASTRGGQNIACAGFDDYAIKPKPHAIVRDIQRYGVENRGGPRLTELAGDKAQPTMEETISDAAFGMSEAQLKQEADRMRAAYDRANTDSERNRIVVRSTLEPRNVLLLSGGGQWGAYGAGLFLGMACTEAGGPYDANSHPCLTENPGGKRQLKRDLINFDRIDAMDIGVITGVSTGSLQSILLMVVLDQSQRDEARKDALQQLLDSYAPLEQSDLVDYDGFEAVIFQGSVAGTDQLREHVGRVLNQEWGFRDGVRQPDGSYTGDPVAGRKLVDQIGHSPITTLVGVVQGFDGDFRSVNMKRMVSEIQLDASEDPERDRSREVDCVLATTLASSAMPVFHQQLRVTRQPDASDDDEGVTLFDGGVRRSVFISELGDAFARRYSVLVRSLGTDLYALVDKSKKLPKMYVLRNGPTTSVFEPKVDSIDNAIVQAMRAYELLVNELEVSSIASLRLSNPYGEIVLSTADGSEDKEYLVGDTPDQDVAGPRRPGCKKNGEMFDPDFMVCLQNFGIRRGMKLEVDKDGQPIPDFWPVSAIEERPRPTIRPPANDNEPANDP